MFRAATAVLYGIVLSSRTIQLPILNPATVSKERSSAAIIAELIVHAHKVVIEHDSRKHSAKSPMSASGVRSASVGYNQPDFTLARF